MNLLTNISLLASLAIVVLQIKLKIDINNIPIIQRDIIDIVDSCPTDALTYYENKYLKKENTMENETRDTVKIKALTDGPLLVEGILEITDGNGNKIDTQGRTALCRCGHSKTKPFCDGSHKTIGFKE